LKVAEDKYLEYYYELKPDDYMMDFSIRSQNLNGVIDGTKEIDLNWDLKAFRHSKSVTYENQYTEINWMYGDGDDDYAKSSENEDDEISWVAYQQHFFSSILLTDTPFEHGRFVAENLVEDEEVDTVFTKSFASNFSLQLNGGELNENMNMYYGPTDFKRLESYDRNLTEIVPLGWGIFGWINQYALIPLFNFFLGIVPAGIAIILLTISLKLLLSPVQYKQYVSQAKMKVLKPEINELNEKYKDNQMKKQQETMKLQSKAGASPMAGCIPGLLQLPVFYALFRLFPSAFELRHKSFLWADDLASYDVVANLPFHIPFYGDHVSLFPILASIAIFFYMTMTMGQSMQTSQPGMPNMKFIMYLSPLFMLIFFNNFASGLSLYYFISNLITIGIMLVIKTYIIDDDKIHAKIQANKKKPKKKKGFRHKMQKMMEEAEKQKNQKN
jgi:YidC/Oxa1 family membrane protein insertase